VINHAQLDEARRGRRGIHRLARADRGHRPRCRDRGVPILPGIATASDIMRGLDLGLTHFKFFPAEAAGGIKALKALVRPFRAVPLLPDGRDHRRDRPRLAGARPGALRRRQLDRPARRRPRAGRGIGPRGRGFGG
jgi:hypothetical protein